MSKVVYWMSVSLDGFVEARDGKIDWTAPDDELHRFFNEYARRVGVFLFGRRSYELMAGFWPTAHQNPSTPEPIVEFARIWRRVPKTLRHVEHKVETRGRRSRTAFGRRRPPPLRAGNEMTANADARARLVATVIARTGTA